MRITAIQKDAQRRRAHVHLDSHAAMTLSLDVLGATGLRVGDEVSDHRLEELTLAEVRHKARAASLRLLSHRPRSESELRRRLERRGTAPEVAEETITRLKELKLLDDDEFARSWIESRERRSPRGRRLLTAELRAKGVTPESIRESVDTVDEEDAAYRAAARRARSLATLRHDDFRRRLRDFLLRRGFDDETAGSAIARVWEEVGSRESPKE
jgi:regulatory protein